MSRIIEVSFSSIFKTNSNNNILQIYYYIKQYFKLQHVPRQSAVEGKKNSYFAVLH